MKRLLTVLIISFLITHFAPAQIEKDYNLTGGYGRIGFNSDQLSLFISPNFGWFIKNRLAVGGQFSFSVSDGEYTMYLGSSIMPFVRYYLLIPEQNSFFMEG